MAVELTFAAITPRSLAKSRTGGIIARLLADPALDCVGCRMYAPRDAFVDDWIAIMRKEKMPPAYKTAFLDFLDRELRSGGSSDQGYTNRMMVFFFRGRQARSHLLKDVIGEHCPRPSGRTIRGTYGEYAVRPDGGIEHFEPAVVTAPSAQANRALLDLLARTAETDGGVIEKSVPDEEEDGAPMETSLVMIKPDNLARPSTLPGNIIDMFGTTGLYIVGARLFHMSVDQAMRFYGFLENIFVEKLAPQVEVRLRRRLEGIFDFPLTDDDYDRMTNQLREKHAHREMMKIIEYMTGVENPESLKPSERRAGGPATCLGLLYRGPGAVNKIREKLGSTDPSKAAAGTIRSDYGHDLMRNGAHASDSPESAWRERKIVGLLGGEASEERRIVREFLRRQRAPVRSR